MKIINKLIIFLVIVSIIILIISLFGVFERDQKTTAEKCAEARNCCLNCRIVPWVTASCLQVQECERIGE